MSNDSNFSENRKNILHNPFVQTLGVISLCTLVFGSLEAQLQRGATNTKELEMQINNQDTKEVQVRRGGHNSSKARTQGGLTRSRPETKLKTRVGPSRTPEYTPSSVTMKNTIPQNVERNKETPATLKTTKRKPRCKDQIKKELQSMKFAMKELYTEKLDLLYENCSELTGADCRSYKQFSNGVKAALREDDDARNKWSTIENSITDLKQYKKSLLQEDEVRTSVLKKEWKKSNCKKTQKKRRAANSSSANNALYAALLIAAEGDFSSGGSPSTPSSSSSSSSSSWSSSSSATSDSSSSSSVPCHLGYNDANNDDECTCYGDAERKVYTDPETEEQSYICVPPCPPEKQRGGYKPPNNTGSCECRVMNASGGCKKLECGFYGEPDYEAFECVCNDDGKPDGNGGCEQRCTPPKVVASDGINCVDDCGPNEIDDNGVCREECKDWQERDSETRECVLDCRDGADDGDGGCECYSWQIETEQGSCIECEEGQVVDGEKCVDECEGFRIIPIDGRCQHNPCPHMQAPNENGECVAYCGENATPIDPSVPTSGCECNFGYEVCPIGQRDGTEVCCEDETPCGDNAHAEGEECFCDDGYEVCENDPRSCCEEEPWCEGEGNVIDDNGNCFCDEGYSWCDPDGDDSDTSCCEEEPWCEGEGNVIDDNGNCSCEEGYTWCDPDGDDSDTSCCLESSSSDSTSSSSSESTSAWSESTSSSAF